MLTTVMMFTLIVSMSTIGLQQAAAQADNSVPGSGATTAFSQIAGPDSSAEVAIIGCDASDGTVGAEEIKHGGAIPKPGGFAYTDICTAGPLPDLTTACTGGAACDTVILNAASENVDCDLGGTGFLSNADLATLVTHMTAGGKLIIYDSECQGPDGTSSNTYQWLPVSLRFTTQNPGPAGATGSATIVEQNALSTTASGAITSPEIDVVALCTDGSPSDACGDANVLLTQGIDLCRDIDANNVDEPGDNPTHVYSRSGAASGTILGMLIYNGFDYDEQADIPDLQALTLYELEVDFNPHDPTLVCGKPVVPVGGEFMNIDTTSLILAGAQTNAVWLLSALAVIGSVAFGAIYLKTRKN